MSTLNAGSKRIAKVTQSLSLAAFTAINLTRLTAASAAESRPQLPERAVPPPSSGEVSLVTVPDNSAANGINAFALEQLLHQRVIARPEEAFSLQQFNNAFSPGSGGASFSFDLIAQEQRFQLVKESMDSLRQLAESGKPVISPDLQAAQDKLVSAAYLGAQIIMELPEGSLPFGGGLLLGKGADLWGNAVEQEVTHPNFSRAPSLNYQAQRNAQKALSSLQTDLATSDEVKGKVDALIKQTVRLALTDPHARQTLERSFKITTPLTAKEALTALGTQAFSDQATRDFASYVAGLVERKDNLTPAEIKKAKDLGVKAQQSALQAIEKRSQSNLALSAKRKQSGTDNKTENQDAAESDRRRQEFAQSLIVAQESVQAVSSLLNLIGEKEAARTLATAGGAAISIASGLNTIIEAGFSTAALPGVNSVLGGIGQVFGLFGSSGPTMDQRIFEEVIRLRQEVLQMRREIAQNHKETMTALLQISKQIAHLEDQLLRELHSTKQQLDKILNNQLAQDVVLQRMHSDLLLFQKQQFEKDELDKKLTIRHRYEQESEVFRNRDPQKQHKNYDDAFKEAYTFYLYARDISSRYNLSGDYLSVEDLRRPERYKVFVQNREPSWLTALFVKTMQAQGVATATNQTSWPNTQEFALGARAFCDYLVWNHEVLGFGEPDKGYNEYLTNLVQIADQMEQLHHTMMQPETLQRAVAQYQQSVNSLQEAVVNYLRNNTHANAIVLKTTEELPHELQARLPSGKAFQLNWYEAELKATPVKKELSHSYKEFEGNLTLPVIAQDAEIWLADRTWGRVKTEFRYDIVVEKKSASGNQRVYFRDRVNLEMQALFGVLALDIGAHRETRGMWSQQLHRLRGAEDRLSEPQVVLTASDRNSPAIMDALFIEARDKTSSPIKVFSRSVTADAWFFKDRWIDTDNRLLDSYIKLDGAPAAVPYSKIGRTIYFPLTRLPKLHESNLVEAKAFWQGDFSSVISHLEAQRNTIASEWGKCLEHFKGNGTDFQLSFQQYTNLHKDSLWKFRSDYIPGLYQMARRGAYQRVRIENKIAASKQLVESVAGALKNTSTRAYYEQSAKVEPNQDSIPTIRALNKKYYADRSQEVLQNVFIRPPSADTVKSDSAIIASKDEAVQRALNDLAQSEFNLRMLTSTAWTNAASITQNSWSVGKVNSMFTESVDPNAALFTLAVVCQEAAVMQEEINKRFANQTLKPSHPAPEIPAVRRHLEKLRVIAQRGTPSAGAIQP